MIAELLELTNTPNITIKERNQDSDFSLQYKCLEPQKDFFCLYLMAQTMYINKFNELSPANKKKK